MKKTGDIDPAHTPDTDHVLSSGEKRGGDKAAAAQLDDDVFRRLAECAEGTRAPPKRAAK